MHEEINPAQLEEQADEIYDSLQALIDSYCHDMKMGPIRPRGVDLAEVATSVFADCVERGEEAMARWSWMMAAALQRLGDAQLKQEGVDAR